MYLHKTMEYDDYDPVSDPVPVRSNVGYDPVSDPVECWSMVIMTLFQT